MPQEDSMEFTPSEDGGNGLPPEAPKAETPAETPVEPTVEAVKEPVVEELYELPDGRKVDAGTLTKEWKENFLPDYTRKSQELAKVKTTAEPVQPNNPLADPNYVPQTYEELAAQIEERTLAKLAAKEQSRIDAQQAIENTVINQLSEVKKLDANLDENKLFLHATKYKFNDLGLAYQNMKDMSELAKNVQKTTAQNIAKRNDPVSVSPGATGARPEPSHFENARGYLNAIKT